MDHVGHLCFVFVMLSCPFLFLSVHCSLVATCWERADLLALLYVLFYCVFVTFPCGVLGQVWYLIVSIPDLCRRTCLISGYSHTTTQLSIFPISQIYTQPNS